MSRKLKDVETSSNEQTADKILGFSADDIVEESIEETNNAEAIPVSAA